MAIQSPCNKICVVDPAGGLCLGCGRSLVEIASWTSFTDEQRVEVMAELPTRLAALSPRRPVPAKGV
jgi:predicted Fe-S protein YdhL (DUF1289 family)